MNKYIEDFARKTLKESLSLCTKEEQAFFKKMYAPFTDIDINVIVDNLGASQLQWALTQVENTLRKKGV